MKKYLRFFVIALVLLLFIGMFVFLWQKSRPKPVVYEEFTNDGQHNLRFYRIYLFAVRYVCPLCIMLIFLHQLGVI